MDLGECPGLFVSYELTNDKRASGLFATAGSNQHDGRVKTKRQSTKHSSNPRKKLISLLGGSYFIDHTHLRGTKGLMGGSRGPIPPAAAMIVMVVVGPWRWGMSIVQ